MPKQGVVGAERRVERPGTRGPRAGAPAGYKGGAGAKQYVLQIAIGKFWTYPGSKSRRSLASHYNNMY